MLILPFIGLAQEGCWSFNTVEKNNKYGTTYNSNMCVLDNKDVVINLEGEKFYFEYISHTIETMEGIETYIVKTVLGTKDIFYIFIFDEDMGILVTDEYNIYPTWYYNE